MYRQYENPYTLTEELHKLEAEYQEAIQENADEEKIISFAESIAELKDRINFAWQDDEFDGYDEF